MEMIHHHIEEIISQYLDLMGKEYEAYKNHVHRVSRLTLSIKKEQHQDDALKIAIAGVHHDIGIWTANTFDYLAPSIVVANRYLQENELTHWSEEIGLIIDMHHRRSAYSGNYADNVDAFRRADIADVTKGKRGGEVDGGILKMNYEQFPMLGFRMLILKRFFKNLLINPLNPLPMMKK